MALDGSIPWLATASRRAKWLVGVSGGADSVALLHWLRQQGFRRLIVCHLDHRLRGRSSTADARFVARLAEELGLACEIGRGAVRERMVAEGISMESAARLERHAFFARCAARHRCRRLILAHHLDDQAETVLWNLLRGSHDLRGMAVLGRLAAPAAPPIELHRPLLGCRRAELREWLEARGLAWREDASNALPLAVRNRLRHEALPLLAEICGRDPAPRLASAAAAAAEREEVIGFAVESARALDPAGRVHLGVFRELPAAVRAAVMADFLRRHQVPGIDRNLVVRAVALADPAAARAMALPGGGRLRRRAGRLFIEDVPPSGAL